MMDTYRDTVPTGAITPQSVRSLRKLSTGQPRETRQESRALLVAIALAVSTVALVALGLAAFPDGRGLVVGGLLVALAGLAARGTP